MSKQWSFYLCGPVEHDNNANDWRVQITSELQKSIKDPITVYNPMDYPNWSASKAYNFDNVFDKKAA